MEEIINGLINDCVAVISNQDEDYEIVGNRMHFPMLITANSKGETNEFLTMEKTFKRIWPATYSYVNIIRADSNEHGYTFWSSADQNKDISVEEIQQRYLEKSSRHPECFENLGMWSYYNIINTELIRGFDDFKKQYELIDCIEGEVICSRTHSMVIVVLDDATYSDEKRQLNKQIRDFLKSQYNADGRKYQGLIILSNKSNSGQSLDFAKEILSLISTVIVASANDAVGIDDDSNYTSISTQLYSGTPLTAAQCLMKKPYKDISLFLINELIEYASRVSEQQGQMETGNINWESVLKIENGKVCLFKDFIDKTNIEIDFETLKHMPFSVVPPKGFDIKNELYSSIARYMVQDSLDDYICSLINDSVDLNEFERVFEEYEKSIFSEVSATDFSHLDERSITSILGKINNREPNKDQSLKDYIRNYMEYQIYKTILIPKIERIMFSIKESTSDLRRKFLRFKDKFVSFIPVAGFEHLGNRYQNAVDNYCHSQSGMRSLKYIFRPGNGNQEFSKQLLNCVKEIVSNNKDLFNVSFLQHWVMMLQGNGENKYAKLLNEFGNAFNKRIFYYTNYSFTDGALDIYIFHTKEDGLDTELFKYLEMYDHSDSPVCYLNTGRDSSIEAIRFYRLDNYLD